MKLDLNHLQELDKKDFKRELHETQGLLMNNLGKLDRRTQDLLHILEKGKVGIIKRLLITREITRIREERRITKDSLSELRTLRHRGHEKVKSSRKRIEKRRTLHENRYYTFRELTEKEIKRFGGECLTRDFKRGKIKS